MQRALWIVVVLCLCPASAEGQSTLPFGERELAKALSARAPELAISDLRVERAGTLFVVSVGPNVRVVDLAGSTGMDAARVVALVACDLALQDVKVSALPAASSPTITSAPPAAPAQPADRARVGVQGSLQRGVYRAVDTWGFTLGLEGAVIAQRLLTTLHAGYWTMPSARSRYTGTLIRYDALQLRAGLGVQLARYALVLGPVYAHYWVSGGKGHTGNLLGASLQGGLQLPAAAHLRLGVSAYLDAYPRRVIFHAGGDEPVLVTPAWAIGLALSVTWGWA